MKIHPVFHISLLEPAPKNTKTQNNIAIKQETYKIKKILAEKTNGTGRTLYLVKWKGYNHSENTWEPIENLEGAQETLADYWQRGRTTIHQAEVIQDWQVMPQHPRAH